MKNVVTYIHTPYTKNICMYMSINTYIYIYICIYIYIYVYLFTHFTYVLLIHKHTQTHIHTDIYVYIRIRRSQLYESTDSHGTPGAARRAAAWATAIGALTAGPGSGRGLRAVNPRFDADHISH